MVGAGETVRVGLIVPGTGVLVGLPGAGEVGEGEATGDVGVFVAVAGVPVPGDGVAVPVGDAGVPVAGVTVPESGVGVSVAGTGVGVSVGSGDTGSPQLPPSRPYTN